MDAKRLSEFTKRLFSADAGLNVFLGLLFILFPVWTDQILTRSRLLPPGIYRVIGAVFLLYAAWQVLVLQKNRVTTRDALPFAAVMALVPFILLTTALVLADLPLILFWRILLWIGNIYMLLLAVWYVFIARLLP